MEDLEKAGVGNNIEPSDDTLFWNQVSSVLRDENYTTMLQHVSATGRGRRVSVSSDILCNNKFLLQLFGIRQELDISWREITQLFGKVFPELPLTKFRWKVETCVCQAQHRLALGEPFNDFFDIIQDFCSIGPICDRVGIHEADIIGDTDDLRLKISSCSEPVILSISLVHEITKFARKKNLTIARQNVIFQALGANQLTDIEFKEVCEDTKRTYNKMMKSKKRNGLDGKSEFERFDSRLSRLVERVGAANTCCNDNPGSSSQQTENQPRILEQEEVRPTLLSDNMKLMHTARDMRVLKGELAERELEVSELNAKLSAYQKQTKEANTN